MCLSVLERVQVRLFECVRACVSAFVCLSVLEYVGVLFECVGVCLSVFKCVGVCLSV